MLWTNPFRVYAMGVRLGLYELKAQDGLTARVNPVPSI